MEKRFRTFKGKGFIILFKGNKYGNFVFPTEKDAGKWIEKNIHESGRHNYSIVPEP